MMRSPLLRALRVAAASALLLCAGSVSPVNAQQTGPVDPNVHFPPNDAAVDGAIFVLEQTVRERAVLDGVNVVLQKFDGSIFRQKGWITIGDISRFRERLEQDDVQTFIDPVLLKQQDALAMYVLRWRNPDYSHDLVLQIEPKDFDPDINNNVDSNSILLLWHEMIHAISHGHQLDLMNPSRPFSDWHNGMSDTEAELVDHKFTGYGNNMLCNGLPVLVMFEDMLIKLDRVKQPTSTDLRRTQGKWRRFLYSNYTRFDFPAAGSRQLFSSSDRAEFKNMTGYDIDEEKLIKGYLSEGYRSEPFGLVAAFKAEPYDASAPRQIEFDATKSTGAFHFDKRRFDPSGMPATWNHNTLMSQYPIERYFWVFDADVPGSPVIEADTPKTTHVYETYGTHNVVLFVVDQQDHISSEFEKKVLVEGIDVKLKVVPTSSAAPLPVGFNAKVVSASHPNGVLFLWDFDGDGVYDETDNDEADFRGQDSATAVYKKSGTYQAAVQVIDTMGHSDIARVTITVADGVTAVLNATPISGPPPLNANFTSAGSSSSAGSLTDWEWDFNGNGIYNESANGEDSARGKAVVSHTFDKPGAHQVKLRLTDDQNNVGEAVTTITVEAGLTASFTISPPGGSSPLVVQVDAKNSTYPQNETVTYIWDFDAAGKGKPYQSVGDLMTVDYPKDGTYQITLKLRDSQGNESAEFVQYLTVGLQGVPPVAAIKIIDVSTGGSHDAVSAGGMIPLRVKFSAAESTDPDGQVVKYTWHFDDWTQPVTTTTPEVWHEYSLTSIFKPTVIVTDDFGNDSANMPEVSVKVGVAEPVLTVDQSPDPSGGTLAKFALLGTYIDSQTTLTGCRWHFGDNTPPLDTTTGNATHVYAQSGTYLVKVEVSYQSSAGGTATVETQKTVQISGQLTAKLVVLTAAGGPATNPVPVSTQVIVSATGSSSAFGAIAKCEFDLDGDGSYETDIGAKLTLAHTFSKNGATMIGVRITDVQGNTATKQLTINVGVLLTAALSVTPTTGLPPLKVTCDASGSVNQAGAIHHYIWDITQTGGAHTSNEYTNAVLVYDFPDPGEYIIRVTACDDLGNQSVPVEQRVIVGAPVTAVLTATPSSGAPPLTVQLSAEGSTGIPAIIKHEWDLDGDGVYEADTGAAATNSVTFNNPGTYVVGLQVTDGANQTANATTTVTVGTASTIHGFLDVAGIDTQNQFGYKGSNDGIAPLTCRFDGWVNAYGATITSFAIDYTGNGNFVLPIGWGEGIGQYTHMAQFRDYTYTKPGIYEATMRVTDGAGNSITVTRSVYVD